jgi:hypothetical protein
MAQHGRLVMASHAKAYYQIATQTPKRTKQL